MYSFLSGTKSSSILLNISAPYIFSSSELFRRKGGDGCCFPKYTLYMHLLLNTRTSACPAFWKGKRAHLPSTRVQEMLDAGALSVARTAREPGSWGREEERKSVCWWEKRAAGNSVSDKDTWEQQGKNSSANPE